MIKIVDYGMGNLRSVQKAFAAVGTQADIVTSAAEIAAADKLVLPGVAAFRDAIAELDRQGMSDPIREHVAADKPFLGICLGLQLLFDVGYEDGEWQGLGIVPGEVVRFVDQPDLKIPHMGWNDVVPVGELPLMEGIPSGSQFYFVHSYHVVPRDESVIAGRTEHGVSFVSMIARGNLFATQFHPEKSQKVGLKLLSNFAVHVNISGTHGRCPWACGMSQLSILHSFLSTTMQILPAIDLRGGQCVRLRQGDYAQETVFGDDPVAMARRWVADGAERLHLVDLDGAKAGQPVNDGVVAAICRAVDVPCQLGGGIRDEDAIRRMLDDVGVDRVIVGTQALREPDWFRQMTARFPGRVALGLDARDSKVATSGWLEVSETSALDLAKQFVGAELAAVIYTNIANDGMMQGIDDGTIGDLVALADLGLPVIASGGVTTLDDVRRLAIAARKQPRLVGAIVGRALYEGTLSVGDAVRWGG